MLAKVPDRIGRIGIFCLYVPSSLLKVLESKCDFYSVYNHVLVVQVSRHLHKQTQNKVFRLTDLHICKSDDREDPHPSSVLSHAKENNVDIWYDHYTVPARDEVNHALHCSA